MMSRVRRDHKKRVFGGRLGCNHQTECRVRVMSAEAGGLEYRHLREEQTKIETVRRLEVITEERRHEQIMYAKRVILTIETQ